VTLVVDIQHATAEAVPKDDDIIHWIAATLANETAQRTTPEATELSIRLIDREEMTILNKNYRGKSGPTNVLSFPADLPAELNLPLLGDIVICAPVVLEEARLQGKDSTAHWAHMAVHGTLHLLGFDHVVDADAHIMETVETAVLATLGYPCPYANAHPTEHSGQ